MPYVFDASMKGNTLADRYYYIITENNKENESYQAIQGVNIMILCFVFFYHFMNEEPEVKIFVFLFQ